MPLAIFVILIVIALIIVFRCMKIVPESKAYVVQRFGEYHQTLKSGLHLIIPFIDNVAKIISLKEQVVDFPPQPVITKDNATMQIDTRLPSKYYESSEVLNSHCVQSIF